MIRGSEKQQKGGVTERLRQRDAEAVRRRALWVGKTLLWTGLGYLFGIGRMALDTNPLGIALVCACGGNLLGALSGLILAELVLMDNPVLMICTYSAAALARAVLGLLTESPEAGVALPMRLRRILFSRERGEEKRQGRGWLQRCAREVREIFSESVCLRMVLASVCAFTVSLFRIVAGGFRFYDWFAALFLIAVAVASVPVFSAAVSRRRLSLSIHGVCVGLFLFSLVWSADFARIWEIPVSAVLSLLFTLLAAQQYGSLWGAVTGAICGLAYAPILTPAFLLAALVYRGIPWKEKESFAVPVACGTALLWSVYAMGWQSLSVFPAAYLTGGAAFLPISRFLRSIPEDEEKEPVREAELPCMKLRQKDTDLRLRDISEAFSSLSEMLYNLSDRLRRPGALDLRRICDNAFDRSCESCPNKTVCWGLEYSRTFSVLGNLISDLHTKGQVTEASVPAYLRQRCPATERILREINEECARFTGELLNNRIEIFAMDYEACAQIINDALAEDNEEYRFDPELETAISEYLSDAGIRAGSVSVYGTRSRRILVHDVDMEGASVSAETLRCDLGEMCGLELSPPVFEVENNRSAMHLQAKRRFSVMGAQRNLSADGGVSGDSVNLFSNRRDYFYALISDGMGAGREAAFTSNLCSVFLEKMLRAGNRAGTSLRMLNNLIRSRFSDSAGECSTTVDLAELDLITGRAGFIKSGAAPGFVVRRGTVSRLQALTLPIGILRKPDARIANFELREGDTVVMVSDGILKDDPDGAWLTDYLATVGEKEPEAVAEEICNHAAEQGDRDDCSVIVLRICPAET